MRNEHGQRVNQEAAAVPSADLNGLLQQLRSFEPIFHSENFGTSLVQFEERMESDYWEIGASGKRYSREFILSHLEKTKPQLADDLGWICSDFQLQRLGPDIFLLTYLLDQCDRITRRSTIWRKSEHGWRVVFHQGTVVSQLDSALT